MIGSKPFRMSIVFGIGGAVVFFAARSLLAERNWPPTLDQPFPDIALIDQTGQAVRMSSFKGKVVLVEYVGMTCTACQAFSGAHDVGVYGGASAQQGLESIERLFPKYTGGVSLDDEQVVFVQILLYDMSMGAPTATDVRDWARHFGFDRSRNQVVLAGKRSLLGKASYNLIPGFQLIDKNSVIRSDSTGHQPRHNLFTELLPMVSALLWE